MIDDETTDIIPSEPNAYETALAMVQHLDAQALIAKAIERNVGIDTMERLLALRERLKAEQAKELFFAALSAFQAECPIITKTKVASIQSARGSYKYAYAPLDMIVREVSPILAKYGLSVTTETKLEYEPMLLQVAICTVHHVAGHSQSSEFRAPIDNEARMNDMQKAASAQTYARRYAYCNALGILTGDDDDDAHATNARQAFPPPRRTTTPGPMAGEGSGDTRPSQSMSAPPARDAAPISSAQHRSLEAEITQYAAAMGGDPKVTRQWLKDRIGSEFGKEHFPELTPQELTTVMGWLHKAWKKKA